MNSHINCPCCNTEIKVNTYTDSMRNALKKYREANPEIYNNNSKKYYLKKKEDPEWREKLNERQRKNRLLRKEKLREEKELLEKLLKEKNEIINN
jgi:hypothetical protein